MDYIYCYYIAVCYLTILDISPMFQKLEDYNNTTIRGPCIMWVNPCHILQLDVELNWLFSGLLEDTSRDYVAYNRLHVMKWHFPNILSNKNIIQIIYYYTVKMIF
jgi:hypothetical protein